MSARRRGRPQIKVTPAQLSVRREAARAFKALRESLGLTQAQVGVDCGVAGKGAVSNWESGDRTLPERARAWMARNSGDA